MCQSECEAMKISSEVPSHKKKSALCLIFKWLLQKYYISASTVCKTILKENNFLILLFTLDWKCLCQFVTCK